jgi:hypothetical protein
MRGAMHCTPRYALIGLACSALALASDAPAVQHAESIYADLMDAAGVVGAIDSGLFTSYRGRDRAQWQRELDAARSTLAAELPALDGPGLAADDARIAAILRERLAALDADDAATLHAARCRDAAQPTKEFERLSAALVACFTEIANNLEFEGRRIDRASALALLHQIPEPARRKALFDAFQPLWVAVNGSNTADSPYRRLIALAAAQAQRAPSHVELAARTVGASVDDIERWLVQVLEAWRNATPAQPVEPWYYRYSTGVADRVLSERIPLGSLLAIDHRYYRDLGVDLDGLGVLYDLAPRPDKSSVAYTDFLVRGRYVAGVWQPTVARVLASYADGSLAALNELVHENGHAAHITAIRNRPVFVDWNDTLLVEAFADVPSWSVYDPAWQRKYLGASAPSRDSFRALFGSVMLDVAWALFEIRLLREPTLDPNALWTDITSRYLRIVPHPELSWWAVRVQLVDGPGYMVNYGLGAIVTAELRARIREAIGPFDTGNARWYPWLSANLLRYGSETDTATLLREFLGRPASPDALLALLRAREVQ